MNCKHDFHIYDTRTPGKRALKSPKLGIEPMKIRVYRCKKCNFKKRSDEYYREELQEYLKELLNYKEIIDKLKNL